LTTSWSKVAKCKDDASDLHWMKIQLKKYGDLRTFCKSKLPLSGRGGNCNVGYDVWKSSSNWGRSKSSYRSATFINKNKKEEIS
jgi:hypothetical protein